MKKALNSDIRTNKTAIDVNRNKANDEFSKITNDIRINKSDQNEINLRIIDKF